MCAPLAGVFLRQMDIDTATRCLDAVIAAPDVTPELRQRALAQCANVLDKMGQEEAAARYYEVLIEEYPHSELAQRAYVRLGREVPSAEVSMQATASGAPLKTSPAVAAAQPAVHLHGKACPACNSAMQQRRANKGAHEGEMFWVCTGYPACKSVVSISQG